MRHLHYLYAPDEPPSGDPTPPAPVTPAVPQSPWSSDIETYFEDPNARLAADRLIREKIQPHVTQVETQYAQTEAARRLFDDLVQDSDATLAAIVKEVYGDEAATKLAEILPHEEPPAPEPDAPPKAQLSDEERVAIEWAQAQRRESLWKQQLAPFQTEGTAKYDPDFDEMEFSPFVVTANGDVEKAYEGYVQWRDRAKTRWAPATDPPAEEEPPNPLADAAPPVPPNTSPAKQTMAQALDAMIEDMRTGAPPTVGSV